MFLRECSLFTLFVAWKIAGEIKGDVEMGGHESLKGVAGKVLKVFKKLSIFFSG